MSLVRYNLEIEDLKSLIHQYVETEFDALQYREMLYDYDMLLFLDLDGVFNIGYPIFFAYLKGLADENKVIRENFSKIENLVKEIKPGYVKEPVSEIEYIFRISDVRLYQHENACKNLDKYLDAPNHLALALAELASIGCDMYCISGSPDEPVKDFVYTKMGIERSNAYGSVFSFESNLPDARFVGIRPVIYEHKTPIVEKILEERRLRGITDKYVLVVSDEPGDLSMAVSFPHLLVLVSEMGSFPEEDNYMIVKVKDFQEDARKLTNVIMKIKLALWDYYEHSEEQRNIVSRSLSEIERFVNHIEKENLLSPLKSYREGCVESFHGYIKNYFGSEDDAIRLRPLAFSKILENIYLMEDAKTPEEIKAGSREFWIKFREYFPYFLKQG